jgi:hypothetical protein
MCETRSRINCDQCKAFVHVRVLKVVHEGSIRARKNTEAYANANKSRAFCYRIQAPYASV